MRQINVNTFLIRLSSRNATWTATSGPMRASRLTCAASVASPSWTQLGANVIKLFTAVSYEFSKKARAFVPGKLIHPILMFAGKSRSLP